MKNSHSSWLALLLLVGCGDGLPQRTSPTPTPLASAVPADAVIDTTHDEATWYEPSSGRVMRLRDGAVEPVQDRTFEGLEVSTLRVLADDSVAMLVGDTLRVQPPGDVPAETYPAQSVEFAFAGTAAHDLWYVVWHLGIEEGYELCHITGAGTECVTEVPNIGGYSPAIGVAPDGSVYVTDRDEGVYRWYEGTLRHVGTVRGGVSRFRPTSRGVLAMGYQDVLVIEGDALRVLYEGVVLDALPEGDGAILVEYDSRTEQVDPDCDAGWFGSCERRVVWDEIVVRAVGTERDGELAHEGCDYDMPETTICERTTHGLARDGGLGVIVGAPLRTFAR